MKYPPDVNAPPDSLVFDLDGTLWDTTASCAVAWNNVLARLGISYREIVEQDVRVVTGKPHEECIRLTFHDLEESQIQQISHETMTEDNLVIASRGGTLYPGVYEGLQALKEKYRLFIVSNCQAGYIETFLGFSGLGGAFEDFECWGRTGLTKAENLRLILDRNNAQAAAMVGDTDGDEAAALACAVPFAFVSYGFGKAQSPDLSFDSFEALTRRFLSNMEARSSRPAQSL